MENMVKNIKDRLVGLRQSYGYSIEELALATDLSVSDYAAMEKDGVDYSFNFLHKCAKKYGIEVAEIISGENPKLSKFQFVKNGNGLKLYRREKFNYEHLSYMMKNSAINPFRVVAIYSEEDEKAPIKLATHSGEEFDFVLKGQLKVQIGNHSEILSEGDSVGYNSSQPHGMVAVGGADCIFLAITVNRQNTDILGDYAMVNQPEKAVEKDNEKHDEIWSKYISVKESSDGVLEDIQFNPPDNFNFAYDIVDALAETKPNKLAMLWLSKNKEEIRFSFADMSYYSTKAANYFASLGIGKGDKVMLVMKRHYHFWYAILGLHKLGAIVIPATNLLTEKDFAYRFTAGDVKALLCTADGETAHSAELAEVDVGRTLIKMISTGERDGWSSFETGIMNSPATMDRVPSVLSEPMLMFFTSGTTGYPRLAVHDFTYPLGHFVTAKYWHRVNPNGIHFTIADTGWGKALWGKLYGQWLSEAAVFTYDFDKFDAKDILPLFAKHKITTFCAPPTMYRFFIKEDLKQYDLSSLERATIAGEALNPEVFNQFYEVTGLKLMEGFGQTETALSIANLFGTEPKPGSMGKPNPQYDVRIIDDNGNPVNSGEIGEIAIMKKAVGIFDGYYKNDEYTEKAWKNGMYHCGDTAWMDEDGYYWYVGRNDDIIKSSGYRIGPFEIESVLMELPYIVECGVTGAPDPIRGQIIKATIVLTKNVAPSEELKVAIQKYFKERTAPYKYPRIIEFVESLPKTISGKIRRVELK